MLARHKKYIYLKFRKIKNNKKLFRKHIYI